MKLHYSYGNYRPYNPCSLYETLFPLFNNSFEDVTIVWNNPKIAKKFLITTIITSIIFIVIYYLVEFDLLNLRKYLQ